MSTKTVKRFQYYYDLPANVRKIADTQNSPFIFFHYDNDRVTRGYLVATGGDFFNVISHMVELNPNLMAVNDHISPLVMPGGYMASAVCAPEDTVDPEVGEKIVMERLLDAYHKDFHEKYKKFYHDFLRTNARLKKYAVEHGIQVDSKDIDWYVENPDYL